MFSFPVKTDTTLEKNFMLTVEDTGKGVELFGGELEITSFLKRMGVWLSRVTVEGLREESWAQGTAR